MTNFLRNLLAWGAMGALLLATSSAQAILIEADDPVFGLNALTVDTETGLEWLDVTETVNLSADDIVGGVGGFAAEGWVHATVTQIETLFLNAGIVPPFDGTQSPVNFAGADLIISLLGSTGSFGDSISIQAFSGTPGASPGSLFTPVVITSFGTVGGGIVPAVSVPSSVRIPTIGNWLVRESAAVPVATIDIKPQSCPNPLNTKSKGVIPVAVLGASDFDVTQVDTSSLRLEGVPAIRSSIEDVATPFESTNGLDDALDCNDFGPDGFDDLTLKFNTQEVIAALGTVQHGDVLVLTLTGSLLDGTAIEGQDVVVIKAKGGGNN